MTCKNCNAEVHSTFCPDCGQPKSVKRIDGHYLVQEFRQILHFDRGMLYTIKELLTNPGQSIINYLTVSRNRLIKPITFILVTSVIYTIAINFFHIEDSFIKFEGEELATTVKIFKWINGHYGYANIIMGIFITFWIKLFFRKSGYNLFEILILLCFVMGVNMLIYSLFAAIADLTKLKVLTIGGEIGIGYCTWAIGQFFGKNNLFNYVKAFLAYVLGMITFAIVAILCGIGIQYIMQ
jgi:Protein of unknown function (DUF3667)